MILKAFIVAEKTEVHVPVGAFADGFFVTHTKEQVETLPEDTKWPPYNPYNSPVPVMDMENVPVRQMRDPFIMKSNYVSYATHASWQQKIDAAVERSRNYLQCYLQGLLDVEHEAAEMFVITSGTAVCQSRQAVNSARSEGLNVGLVKLKPQDTIPMIKQREKDGLFQKKEYISEEAQAFLDAMEEKE